MVGGGMAGGAMAGGLMVALSAKDQASAVFGKVGKSSTGMAATIGAAMAKINFAMLAAGAVMAIFAAVSIKAAISFQEEVAKAMMMFGETSVEQFSRVSDATRKSAAEFGISANEAAQAMWYMGSAGLDTASAIQILNDVVKFAKVGNLELADAASASMTAMRVYEYEAKDVAHVTDMMFVAMRNALMTQGDFNEAMKMVAPVAKAAHLSFAEMSAIIGTFANLGIKGSMAGTSLRRGLLNLMAPTGRVTAALASLNVKTYTTEGNLRHVFEILGDMTRALPTVSEETANLAMTHIFGLRAVAPFTGMLRRGVESLDEYAVTIETAGGLQEAWTAYSETAAVQLAIFKETLSDVARTIGMEMLPPLILIVKGVRWFIDVITTALGPFKTLIAYFIMFVGPLLILKALLPILIVLVKKMVYAMTVGLVRSLWHAVLALKAFVVAKWAAIAATLGLYTATLVLIGAVVAATAAIILITVEMDKQARAQLESIEAAEQGAEAYGIVGEAIEDLTYVTEEGTSILGTFTERYEALRDEVLKLQEPTEQQLILTRELTLAIWEESETLFAMAEVFVLAREEIKDNERALRDYTIQLHELDNLSRSFTISEMAARLRIMEIERQARLEGRYMRAEEIYEIGELEAGLEELRYQQASTRLEAELMRAGEEDVRWESQNLKWSIDDTTEALESQLWSLVPIPEALEMIYNAGLGLSEWEQMNLLETLSMSTVWSDFAVTMTDVVVPAIERAELAMVSFNRAILDVESGFIGLPQPISIVQSALESMFPPPSPPGLPSIAQAFIDAIAPAVTVPSGISPLMQRIIRTMVPGAVQWEFPSFQAGGVVPSTGLYHLERGEEVRTAGARTGDTYIRVEIGQITSKADADYLIDQLSRKLYMEKQLSGVR